MLKCGSGAARRDCLQFTQFDRQFVEQGAAPRDSRAKLTCGIGQYSRVPTCHPDGGLMSKFATPNYLTSRSRGQALAPIWSSGAFAVGFSPFA